MPVELHPLKGFTILLSPFQQGPGRMPAGLHRRRARFVGWEGVMLRPVGVQVPPPVAEFQPEWRKTCLADVLSPRPANSNDPANAGGTTSTSNRVVAGSNPAQVSNLSWPGSSVVEHERFATSLSPGTNQNRSGLLINSESGHVVARGSTPVNESQCLHAVKQI